MRVFVTGASGFIGSHVVRSLRRQGCEVAILVSSGNPLTRLSDLAPELVRVEGRLADLPTLIPALHEFMPDSCIHCAWYAEPGKYLTSPLNTEYLTESMKLIDVLHQIGCLHVVMVGTCAEYDASLGYFDENSPTRPETIYAACKLAMATVGPFVASQHGIKFAWARLFYQYGPHEDKRRMVPALIDAMLHERAFEATAGEQIRDYLHVEDVAAGLAKLAMQQATGIYNIASGIPISIRELMSTIQTLCGRKDLIEFGARPYPAWEPMSLYGSNDKLKALGWSPGYSLELGLMQTIQWWQGIHGK
jgi:nucleoside-diphosphate-sugar epimerase